MPQAVFRRCLRAAAMFAALSAVIPVLSALAPAGATELPAAGPGDATTCAANVADTAEFVPVLGLDLPATSVGIAGALAPVFDRTAEVAQGFDRVGYCLELDGPQGPQWVWTAMEPFTTDATRLDPPTIAGEIVRQRVGDLDVASNVAGVAPVDGGNGFLESWPNSYTQARPGQIFGASATTYDAEDTPATGAFGSFGIHSVAPDALAGAAPQTVLSVTGLTQTPGAALGLGIGTSTMANPDWTFAANGATYTTRRLTVFARPAVVAFDRAPEDRQLFPRDADDEASVAIAGTVLDAEVASVRARLWKGDASTDFTAAVGADGGFAVTPVLEAGLHEYRIEFDAISPSGERRVATWDRLVAGDVYVIQGQSNAEARMFSGSANGERSPWIRSFGSSSDNPALSTSDRTWNIAAGDSYAEAGAIGQWGLRMASRLVADHGVPVAVVNGAHSGRPIDFFQRNDADPDLVTTNYGRLRQRLAAAGVLDRVKAVLWYQGENENDNAAVHVAGFTTLLDDWRSEFGSAASSTEYYVWQVRTSPCSNSTPVALRDAQRRLADTHDVTVLSTTGLNGHDGCHYSYVDGYRDMGDQAANVIGRDLLGGNATGVAAPNPISAAYSNSARTTVTVQVRPSAEGAETLTVEAGAAADFRVTGATVTAVTAQSGALQLTLSAPAANAATVSYLSHMRSGPRVLSPGGVGLLAFTMPIADVSITATADPARLVAGGTTTVTVNVANGTADPVSDVSVSPELPSGWSASPASTTLPDLAAGETATATFTVTAPSSAIGALSLPVTTRFTTDDGERTRTAQLALTNSCSAEPLRPAAVTSVSSEETSGEDGRAVNAIDGNPATIWHTRWSSATPAYPHEIVLDLGGSSSVCAFNYQGRATGTNGNIGGYSVYTSNTPGSWGSPAATGTFATGSAPQSVYFAPRSARYVRLVATSPAVTGHAWATAAELSVDAVPAVTAESRCIGSKAYVAVKATNLESGPVSIVMSSAFGSKTFASVAAGRSAVHSFAVRAADVAAGQVEVTATPLEGGGAPVSSTARFTGIACG